MSLAGATISALPHPVAKVIGGAMAIPDQIYDIAQFADSPTVANAAHTAVDFPEIAGKIIPGK